MKKSKALYFPNILNIKERGLVKIISHFRSLLEDTTVLLHLSGLFLVSLIIFIVAEIANLSHFPYLLFPPLASASFTVSYDPESEFSDIKNIILGLTLGALSGWISLEIVGFGAISYILGIFMTGIFTWFSSAEHPSAYSSAVLAIFSRESSFLYVIAVFLSSTFLGLISHGWKIFYEGRANYLYESTREDTVLVPANLLYAKLGARIASGNNKKGKVIILGKRETYGKKEEIESIAKKLEDRFKIRTEIAIIKEKDPKAVLEVAKKYSCDIIVSSWEEKQFTQKLFEGDCDVVALEGAEKIKQKKMEDSLVPIREENELSHLMIELASRLTDTVSVLKIIERKKELRSAEKEIEELIDGFRGHFETRVRHATKPIEDIISKTSIEYDIMFIGASTDRTAVSRLLSPSILEKVVEKVDIPIVIVHSSRASKLPLPLRSGTVRSIFRKEFQEKESKIEKKANKFIRRIKKFNL